MKLPLIFSLLITNLTLHAQTDFRIEVDSTGPNAALNIPKRKIQAICAAASKQPPKLLKEIGFLTSFEERILLHEGYKMPDITKLIDADRNQIFTIIRNAWNEKWSKVYCEPNSSGIDGCVDAMLLMSEQREAFRHLYDTDWYIKANVNRLVNLDPYSPVKDAPMTITDIMEKMLAEKWGQLAYSESLVKDMRFTYDQLIKFGGKKANQLSKEEKELELNRARKEAKEK